jgi:hypothetical protein
MKHTPFKTTEDLFVFLSGADEVQLTDELIIQIVKDKLWSDEKSLKEYATAGARWNKKRNSIVLTDYNKE